MRSIFPAILLTISSLTQIHALPAAASPEPLATPSNPCTNVASQSTQQNYTFLYVCTLKTDYAILGLYYDTCTPLNSTNPQSSSSSATTNVNTLFCCDSAYTTPASFDSLCIWGNGTSMAEWRAQGHPPGQLPTTSAEEMKGASCLVGPVIHPKARCVQVGVEEAMSFLVGVDGLTVV